MILCLDNAISGLDFDPSGTMTASIDHTNVCLISDINTNDYSFHLKMGSDPCNLISYLSFFFKSQRFVCSRVIRNCYKIFCRKSDRKAH